MIKCPNTRNKDTNADQQKCTKCNKIVPQILRSNSKIIRTYAYEIRIGKTLTSCLPALPHRKQMTRTHMGPETVRDTPVYHTLVNSKFSCQKQMADIRKISALNLDDTVGHCKPTSIHI